MRKLSIHALALVAVATACGNPDKKLECNAPG